MCPGIFGKDPERYLREEGLTFRCPVHRGRAAVVDSLHRIVLNHDYFYVSDPGARRRFEADPLRYCGRLTDPVSRTRFRPDRHSPRTAYHGRTYLFPDSTRLRAFLAMPDSFAVRRGP